MNHKITIEIPGQIWTDLEQYSALIGDSPESLVRQLVMHNHQVLQAALQTVSQSSDRSTILAKLNETMRQSNSALAGRFRSEVG